MNLHNLPKLTDRSKKRLGRGLGSGKGKTAGRGQKGQKARGKVPAANVGAGLILYKKLPLRRGYGRGGNNKSLKPETVELKVSQLNIFKANSTVNLQSLVEQNLISAKTSAKKTVKILAEGELTQALNLELPVSAKVATMVEKAGGKVVR